jgi:prevent-host-death family protein
MAKTTIAHKTETTTTLKEQAGEIVERVLMGETIVLTRYNRPVAMLRPLTPAERAQYTAELAA